MQSIGLVFSALRSARDRLDHWVDHVEGWEREEERHNVSLHTLGYRELKVRAELDKPDMREWALERLREIEETRANLEAKRDRAIAAREHAERNAKQWREKYIAEKVATGGLTLPRGLGPKLGRK
jgi:hypothetical protein